QQSRKSKVDLQYGQEQIILRDTAEKFLAANYDYTKFRQVAGSEPGYSEANWSRVAEMGWLGLPFSGEDSGLGRGAVEVSLLMETFGRSLVTEPYIPNVILAGGVVAALGSSAQRQELIAPLIEGKRKLAFAHVDRAPTKATKRDGDYAISGSKMAV